MQLNNVKLFNFSLLLSASFLLLLVPVAGANSLTPALLYFEVSSVSTTSVDFILLLDPISVTFIALVTLIAAAVTVYSQDYLRSEQSKTRLSGLLSLFILSMALFILTPNIITMLIGWDGLGLVSFALVLFYNNHMSTGAALITGLTNRIGDILILCSAGLSLKEGHWDLQSMSDNSSEILYLALMVAACTKSAQFPFSAWLPQAMAAPTPVSALVHSSTLVTAGIYLMVRLSQHFTPTSSYLSGLLFSASLTSVIAGTCALVETDLKKIVALSTLSQLGTMSAALGLGAPLLALFHLIAHALSKSLLFICVGSFISFNKSSQDTRNLKAHLWKSTPVSFVGAFIASLSLCGLPFISGFYSKDLILEVLWQSPQSTMALLSGAASTALTSAYSLKLMKITSEDFPSNESSPSRLVLGSESLFTKIPVAFLSASTLTMGYFLSKSWSLLYTPLLLSGPHKYFACVMLLAGWFLAEAEKASLLLPPLPQKSNHFVHSMFFMETLTSQGLVKGLKQPLYTTFKVTEQGWIEKLTTSASERALKSALKMSAHLATTPMLIYITYGVMLLVTAAMTSKGGTHL